MDENFMAAARRVIRAKIADEERIILMARERIKSLQDTEIHVEKGIAAFEKMQKRKVAGDPS